MRTVAAFARKYDSIELVQVEVVTAEVGEDDDVELRAARHGAVHHRVGRHLHHHRVDGRRRRSRRASAAAPAPRAWSGFPSSVPSTRTVDDLRAREDRAEHLRRGGLAVGAGDRRRRASRARRMPVHHGRRRCPIARRTSVTTICGDVERELDAPRCSSCAPASTAPGVRSRGRRGSRSPVTQANATQPDAPWRESWVRSLHGDAVVDRSPRPDRGSSCRGSTPRWCGASTGGPPSHWASSTAS